MISEALIFLKDHLNEHLSAQSGPIAVDSAEDRVVFLDGEKMDPVSFKLGAVTTLLVNLEEERTLRAADPYVRVSPDGARQRVQPEIRLNLFVLFVARFKLYEQGLSYLSRIIAHFQAHRVLDHQNAPALGDRIEKLIMEMTTLTLAEQNEVWNALRTTYLPSVLYKVKLVAFRDDVAPGPPDVQDTALEASP